jgi:septum formation protein
MLLLLASASPRRKELLTNAGFQFDVFSVPVPEELLPGESGETLARRLAAAKARAAFDVALAKYPGQDLVVLGADTVVAVDQHVLGKPVDAADASRMLHLLAGRTHQVVTAVSVLTAQGQQTAAETTQVTFFSLSQQEIDGYIATGEPMDKAGAYAIQGYASRWVPYIRGCYFNVVGLPIALVSSILEPILPLSSMIPIHR